VLLQLWIIFNEFFNCILKCNKRKKLNFYILKYIQIFGKK
jgi:hypothetical protein